ncbi:hypothetical protein BYT27DRAFT_6449166 [Phlegmacium glaucopus]|nr:hypothetical protein BYT27DRAFT_6661598 [Phlegmacium glaucopus]KAF8816297.1 hypothetical protein BYT27DRAFT_6449166 [Phlegmacium glaucopus]
MCDTQNFIYAVLGCPEVSLDSIRKNTLALRHSSYSGSLSDQPQKNKYVSNAFF